MAAAYQEIVLIDQAYFDALITDIQQAQCFINMEVYIFAHDKMGERIITALSQAAQRGVLVRLLVDGVGSRHWQNEMSQRLKQMGVTIKVYHPLFWLFSQWQPTTAGWKKAIHLITHINSRNHRKTCLIDKKIIYISSANIIDHLAENREWHDVSVKITGLDTRELQFAFDHAWRCVPFREKFHYLFNRIETDPILRFNYSWRKRRSLYKDFLKKIRLAKTRIWIANAYFVPKHFLLKYLTAAAKGGVEVTIIVPLNTDVLGMSLLTRSFFADLLQAGATVLQYKPGILHTKMIIIDDWFCLGSTNLNHRSLHHDLEVDVNIRTSAAQQVLTEQFKKYHQHSHPVTLAEVSQFSLSEKIALIFLRWVRNWF